jgi:hypothetical protein
MQEVLIDRDELVVKHAVENLDNFGYAFHVLVFRVFDLVPARLSQGREANAPCD